MEAVDKIKVCGHSARLFDSLALRTLSAIVTTILAMARFVRYLGRCTFEPITRLWLQYKLNCHSGQP